MEIGKKTIYETTIFILQETDWNEPKTDFVLFLCV
jgi:hypothetical protein